MTKEDAIEYIAQYAGQHDLIAECLDTFYILIKKTKGKPNYEKLADIALKEWDI